MKNIQISERKFQRMRRLHKDYSEIYGDENTVWDIDDLEAMREIGQEFINIFSINFH